MKDDIVAKLSRELEQEIASERQVVYILVEARKLLEQQQALRTFRAFKLCADWAVHPKLLGKDAQLVLKYFDAYEKEHQNSGITITEFAFQPLNEFLSHSKFKAEFIEALSLFRVKADNLRSEEYWRSFIQHYSSVIQDCPLEAAADNTEIVRHVSAQAWPEEMARTVFPGRRVVQWNWTLKNSTKRRLTCALL
jgi:hypothetical protein